MSPGILHTSLGWDALEGIVNGAMRLNCGHGFLLNKSLFSANQFALAGWCLMPRPQNQRQRHCWLKGPTKAVQADKHANQLGELQAQ